MFMRITWGRLKPGRWDHYEQTFKSAVEKASAKGLRRRYLIQDASQPDAGFSISLWRSKEDMLAYDRDRTLHEKLTAGMKDDFTGEFHTQFCEVRYVEDYAD